MIPDDIVARWTSQPEPLLPVVAQGQPGNVLDPARLIQARRMDVHGHHEELIAVSVKFEGEAHCHIFTNESYLFPKWQNPQWCLPVGRHRLRITVLYERGSAQIDFALINAGSSRNDVRLAPWSQS
jgi:hypothetical protein